MSVNDRIKMRRKELGLSAEELAEKIDVSPATVYRYESKYISNMGVDKIEPIAKALRCTPSYLMGWDELEEYTCECHEYPVIGNVAAGFGSEAVEEETGDFEQIPVDWLKGHDKKDFFVLQVKGDSMYPDFKDGDRVLVLRVSTVDSGTIGVMLYGDNEATLKRINYVQGENWLELEPLNREYSPNFPYHIHYYYCEVLQNEKQICLCCCS